MSNVVSNGNGSAGDNEQTRHLSTRLTKQLIPLVDYTADSLACRERQENLLKCNELSNKIGERHGDAHASTLTRGLR